MQTATHRSLDGQPHETRALKAFASAGLVAEGIEMVATTFYRQRAMTPGQAIFCSLLAAVQSVVRGSTCGRLPVTQSQNLETALRRRRDLYHRRRPLRSCRRASSHLHIPQLSIVTLQMEPRRQLPGYLAALPATVPQHVRRTLPRKTHRLRYHSAQEDRHHPTQ